MKIIVYLFTLIGLIGCTDVVSKSKSNTTNSVILMEGKNANLKLDFLTKKAIKDLADVSFDSLNIPRTIENGQLKGTSSKSWTSGFYPGILWKLYEYSRDEKLKNAAMRWSSLVEKEKWDRGTHDLGFKLYCSFGNAYKITNDNNYKDVFITASKTLITRFNPKIGAIRSWDHHEHLWKFPVIIDNMMNLEMLFEATKLTGDSTFYHIANQHALTTLKNHFRVDNSSYHVIDYDPESGSVVKKNTHQGYSHESAWSRGQAWGLYGFLVCYRYTGNKIYLEQSKKITDYIFNHPNMPTDLIPYWDYSAPHIPNEPRDVSAATITASALFELSMYDKSNSEKHIDKAIQILKSLDTDDYKLDTAPFFLKHSVGSIPGKFEMDAPIIYADYFYVEALLRQDKLQRNEDL